VKHLEEIKKAGLEMPSINQIEVGATPTTSEKIALNGICILKNVSFIPCANKSLSSSIVKKILL